MKTITESTNFYWLVKLYAVDGQMVLSSLLKVFSSAANQIHSAVLQSQVLKVDQKDKLVVVQPFQVLMLAKIAMMPVLQLAQLTLPLLASLLLMQISTALISKHGKLLQKMVQFSQTPTLSTSQLVWSPLQPLLKQLLQLWLPLEEISPHQT